MSALWMDVNIAVTVPVNVNPLVDAATAKIIDTGVTYDEAGMDLVWNFVTTAGVVSQTVVTPTNGGNHDWTNAGLLKGMYKIAIPQTLGADDIANDAPGFGYFTGNTTANLPWRGPTIGFRAAALNNALIDGGDNLDTNVVQISGDTTAADNLELMTKTGGAGAVLTLTQLRVDSAAAGGAIDIDNSNGAGINVQGSSTGIAAVGTGGAGILALGNTSGLNITATGGSGIVVSAGANSDGIVITGSGSGDGISIAAGNTGDGLSVSAAAGTGVVVSGAALGASISAISGTAVVCQSLGSDGSGLVLAGNGTGDGLAITAGATGAGVNIDAAGGDGIDVDSAGGHAMSLVTTEAFSNGLFLDGGAFANDLGATTTSLQVDVTRWQSNTVAAFSVLGYPQVDVAYISADGDAANNLEQQYDNSATGLTGDKYPATQAQVGNISTGSAAINTTATTAVITIGTEGATDYTDTHELDLNYHEIATDGTIEMFYEFNIGANAAPTGTLWQGYVSTVNDVVEVYALNWVSVVLGAGTVETFAASANVTGTGTDFQTDFDPGSQILIDGKMYTVSAEPADATHLVLTENYTGTVASGLAYSIGSWEQIGAIAGAVGSTRIDETFNFTSAHVGTGQSSGLVRTRFASSGGDVATGFNTDQILCGYTIVNQSVGYANGSIWIDTISGASGAVPFVNGVADNAVDNLADGLALSLSLGIRRFTIVSGSDVTLIADATGMVGLGERWTFDANGWDITAATISGATVSGSPHIASTGSNYTNCHFGTAGLTPCAAEICGFGATLTLLATGTYIFNSCYSEVAGGGTPILDFGAAIGATAVNMRHYSGGIEIRNMKAGDSMSLEGHGQYVIHTSCTGGDLQIRGHFRKTDNTNGNVTINDDANFKSSVIHYGFAQGSGTGSNQIQLSADASAVNGAYDPSMVMIISGTGAGQTRNILEYEGGVVQTATVDRNWKVNPDATSEYRVLADSGREHVNEGLAQGPGTGNNQIQLNALASSADNAYNGQTVFLRSGTGEDQARIVLAYDGGTQTATIHRDWDVNPDTTTGYSMLPHGDAHVIENDVFTAQQQFLTLAPDSTSVSVLMFLYDEVGYATGLAPGDLLLTWQRPTTAGSSSAGNTLSAITDAYNAWGMFELGGGLYRIDFPDSSFVSGETHVTLYVRGTTPAGTRVLGYMTVRLDPLIPSLAAPGEYKIADTSGDWETAGTWSGGVVPVASDNIIIRNNVDVDIATTDDLGDYGTLELQGNGTLDIDAGVTVDAVPRGWVIDANRGTVTANYGTVNDNTSITTANVGTILINNGTIMANYTAVANNIDTVTDNYGIVANNTGTVADNKSRGVVKINVGTVTVNSSGGVVSQNFGIIGTDNGDAGYPLESIDSGSTLVARTGADGDTLETLSDEIATLTSTVGVAGVGLTEVRVSDAGLREFVTVDTTEVAAAAGSVALLSQSGGGSVTVGDITQPALAKFVSVDTLEAVAAAGSVAEFSQGSAGGNVTVGAMTTAALAQFVTDDTGESSATAGSVAQLAKGINSGTGSVNVDHNSGGTDNLAYIASDGHRVDEALIQSFLKTDYDAGNRTKQYVRGETKTNVFGRWVDPMRLDPATYTLVYWKQDEYGPDLKEYTVTV